MLKNGSINFKDVKLISKEDFDKINKRSNVDKVDILFGLNNCKNFLCFVIIYHMLYSIIKNNTLVINMTLMESDKIILYEFATYKNIQKTTLKDYRIVIIHYTTYFNKTLTELIQEAETEKKWCKIEG